MPLTFKTFVVENREIFQNNSMIVQHFERETILLTHCCKGSAYKYSVTIRKWRKERLTPEGHVGSNEDE